MVRRAGVAKGPDAYQSSRQGACHGVQVRQPRVQSTFVGGGGGRENYISTKLCRF